VDEEEANEYLLLLSATAGQSGTHAAEPQVEDLVAQPAAWPAQAPHHPQHLHHSQQNVGPPAASQSAVRMFR
jgi:hypothetical protein